MQVLGDGPGEAHAIVGRGAAPHLVEDDEAPLRGAVQDVAASVISTMKVDSPLASLSSAPTRVKMRSTTPKEASSAGT